MNTVYISLGSNLGNRKKNILLATEYISKLKNTHILKKTKIIETKALEVFDQPDFLNSIIQISTVYSPIELLEQLQSIEKRIGRIFRYDKGPREIDLDILLFNNISMETERLIIPHPAIQTRPFVQELLSEL